MRVALQVAEGSAFGLDEWIRFLGHLHPLVLHLPIGLLAAVIAMEGAAVVWKGVVPGRRLLSALFGISAAAAALTGWWLGEGADHHPSLVDDHRQFGIAAAGTAVAVGLLDTFFRGRRCGTVRVLVLLVSAGLFTMAGHRGGMMTHGKTFLSETAPPWLAPFVGPAPRVHRAGEAGGRDALDPDPSEAPGPLEGAGPLGNSREENVGTAAVATEPRESPDPQAEVAGAAEPLSDIAIVHGAFQAMCIECHCEAKVKGKLRLDLLDGWKGIIDLEDPDFSELLYRVRLAADDGDAMPPEGDRLPAEAIAALERWIHAGAPTEELSSLLGQSD